MHPPERNTDGLSPDQKLCLATEALDVGFEMAVAAEQAAGAPSREEAERRVGERWKREDAWRLRSKLQRWKWLADARRGVR